MHAFLFIEFSVRLLKFFWWVREGRGERGEWWVVVYYDGRGMR